MKLPFFQFYPGDWLKKTRHLSPAAKGMWIDLMVIMWDAPTRGTLVNTVVGYARLVGASADQAKALIDELTDPSNPTVAREDLPDGRIKLSSRRMLKDEAKRQSGRERVERYRSKETQKQDCNDPVTPLVTGGSEICNVTSEDESEIESLIPKLEFLPERIQDERVAKAWGRWLFFLSSKRQFPPLMTQERQLLECSKWGVDRTLAAIEFSIGKNYKGLYEERQSNPNSTSANKRDDYVAKSTNPDQAAGLQRLRES